jgi:aryl-alcohol dehydrogenase-like predicted oxidoreductase
MAMEYVKLGRSNLQVSRLCLGTWNMCGAGGWGPENDERSIDLIRRAQDDGCNFFDSAHGYGKGHSEEVLGRALAEGDRRERAVVATKVVQCPPTRGAAAPHAALQRLQTGYVDLYVVHWPRPSMSLEALLGRMCELKAKGKVREIGVSNFSLAQMQVALRYGAVSLQPPYNILWRIIEPDVLPFCRENNLAVTPYAPLAQGLLTGRFTRAFEERTGVRKSNVLFEEPVFTEACRAVSLVDEIADARSCTSSQVALAWVLQTNGVTVPIVGISKWSHWQDNVGALKVRLTDEEYQRLSAAGMKVWQMLPQDATMWGWKPE